MTARLALLCLAVLSLGSSESPVVSVPFDAFMGIEAGSAPTEIDQQHLPGDSEGLTVEQGNDTTDAKIELCEGDPDAWMAEKQKEGRQRRER